MMLAVAAAAAVAGVLIGLTGIGGVLLVPALTELAEVPLDRAVAASMMAFLLAGALAAFLHLRFARLDWRHVNALCLASAAGALAGAATLGALPAVAIRVFIALLALASGLHAVLARPANASRPSPSVGTLSALGALVGYGSAISGTGGPVLLIPILLALKTPARTAIAFGLAAQLPISFTATAVHILAGRMDLKLGGTLAVLLLFGTALGSALSRRLSTRGVTLAVAITLILVGLWYGVRTLQGAAT